MNHTRPLTVVTVSTADRGGGAERVARELHESYLAAGEDAWLAVGKKRGDDSRTIELPNRARRSAWTRACLTAADALPQRSAGFWLARGLREGVAQPARWAARRMGHEDFDFPGTSALLGVGGRRPDVLHLHNLHGGYFDLRQLPRLSAATTTILTLHDAWLLSGHCAHSLGCGRWESGCGSCPALWIYPAVPRDATAFNWKRKRDAYAASALCIASPARWLADQVRRSMLMPAVRELRVIPYGVNLDVFTPGDRAAARAELGLDPDRPAFLFFANSLRARSWKDSNAFRGALERLSPESPAARAQWIALGESRADEQVGPVSVRHVGLESDDRRLRRWYYAADAYIHPALADTFPNMVLEALACGTPVIATAVGGIPEQVISAAAIPGAAADAGADRATGALVPGGDPVALAAAIDGFLALDASLRAALGANAARDTRVRFDGRRQEREYLAWMHELASARTASLANRSGAQS